MRGRTSARPTFPDRVGHATDSGTAFSEEQPAAVLTARAVGQIRRQAAHSHLGEPHRWMMERGIRATQDSVGPDALDRFTDLRVRRHP